MADADDVRRPVLVLPQVDEIDSHDFRSGRQGIRAGPIPKRHRAARGASGPISRCCTSATGPRSRRCCSAGPTPSSPRSNTTAGCWCCRGCPRLTSAARPELVTGAWRICALEALAADLPGADNQAEPMPRDAGIGYGFAGQGFDAVNRCSYLADNRQPPGHLQSP
jgi:hypothetical protein